MKERLQMFLLMILTFFVMWFSGFMSYSAAMNPTVEEIYGFYKIENKTIFGTECWYVENGELQELEHFLEENAE